MNDNLALRVKNLTKTYKLFNSHAERVKETFHPFRKKYHHPFNALNNISFEVKKGEAFGIIGRNGSGKSTLLQIVCGILEQTSGTVQTNGRISALLELGAGFNPEFTGRENVYINGKILGLKNSEIDARFNKIDDFADIGEFMDQPVKAYSSGMVVRLAFAVQVCVEPDILVVDEALSVGDIFFQQKCFARMRDIISKGTTCLFVSHDTIAIQNLCQRAIILNQGEEVFLGDATEAVSRYYALVGIGPAASSDGIGELSSMQTSEKSRMKSDDILDNNVIKDEARKNGAGGMRIIAARVTDAFGRDSSQVNLMEPLNFSILIRALKDVLEPNVGIDLFDRIGNLVFCTGATQKNNRLPSIKKGDVICVIFEITFSVQPGQYTFSLGAGEPSNGPNPNIGFVHERVENLGPLTVNYDTTKMLPFYGIALLPTEIQFYFTS